eukprot:2331442-Amphidinium_carterae.1
MTVLEPGQNGENDGAETDSARSANQGEEEEQEWLREGAPGDEVGASEASLFHHCARGTVHRREA